MTDTSQIQPAQAGKTILIAGAFALLAFDFFGQALSPALGYAKLAPVGLANSSIKAVFGATWRPGGELLHYFAGLIAYPLGAYIVELLRRQFLPQVPWLATSAVYGVVLWVFALYGTAHLIAGMKPFLGFTGITWVAFWGHVLFGVVATWVIQMRDR
ncbi:hypothetical protein ACMU_17720 [Actibacterium mucosum KCTC 23349]|uniref:Uncharacterized protein n=1 Tax=Actibacterium mucosum KCTC 23349 TaxID=1454373 RepID=A0A037ZIA4_9RHOB|nr:hypothetical protein [Actibacterium mucosum]KAJ54545.1 hypothetical protein ACMU_17720 [Actibacterium mucosum KCTC 23349]